VGPILLREADDLAAVARAHAARGEWEALRSLLSGRSAEVERRPELATLLAEAQLRTGRLTAALALLQTAVAVLERSGNPPELRRAVNMLGAAYFELGQLPEAEATFGRALELANTAGADLIVGRATNNLGLIANIRGHPGEALARYRLAIPAYQRAGNPRGLAETFHNMAVSFRDLRQLEEADRHERRTTEFAREAGSEQLLAMAAAGRAELSFLRGDARVAEVGALAAAERYGAIPDPIGEADALRLAGAARRALGAPARARPLLDRAVALARRHGSALVEAESLRARAELSAALGERAAAQADVTRALALYEDLGAQADRDDLRRWWQEL
jgi:tetratricopeptide (TPR) repeat protein